jgi:hypothetical protein
MGDQTVNPDQHQRRQDATALASGREDGWTEALLAERLAGRCTDAIAALAASPEPAEGLDERIRYQLWRNHGHDFIYGDDGELQCNWSLHIADFRRDPWDRLIEHCNLAALTAEQPAGLDGAGE